jgi:hypothetical protein
MIRSLVYAAMVWLDQKPITHCLLAVALHLMTPEDLLDVVITAFWRRHAATTIGGGVNEQS